MELNTQKIEDSPSPSQFKLAKSEHIEITITERKLYDEDIELQQLFTKLNSTIDETPFHETKCQKQKQDLSYKSQFELIHFLQFYIYQILFYIFGPFVYIFLFRKPALMYNLGYWSFRQDVIFQYIQWAGHVFCVFVYFQFEVLSILEMSLVWFSLLMRCIIVAAKFGTLNEERILLYEQQKLPEKTIKFDSVLFDWLNQTRKMKMLEIARSSKRHDFDTQFFYFHFIVEPMKETQKAILQEISDDFEAEQLIENFSGIGLLSFFIESFQKLNTKKHIFLFSFLLSCAVIISPKFLNSSNEQDIYYEIILKVITGIFQAIQFNCTFNYLFIALDDMKRKIYMLDQCYYLISTKRVKCCECKLTPTVDINCPKTIEAWSMLRSITFDYGLSYHIRNQVYFTILILFCIISIIFALQLILGYYIIGYQYLIPLGVLSGVFLLFVICYLLSAAKINSFFEDFSTQIENLKFICNDVKRLKKNYFEDQSSEPQNFIHKSFVNHLKKQLHNNTDSIYSQIDLLIESLESALRHIEYDSRNYPLQVYGIKISYEILQNLTVGLFTVISFVVQQRFSSS